ncbi:hypothetical protein V6N12_047928 [Hibiscus sabdariffa]|uniref:RNase H type-1 domain-containing protein n=1 Tax=Hibiscus sabdariffa TaxID=183260 RepID=A0ABR2CUV9_9ROSI
MELTPIVLAVWKPPPMGWLKFNVDGAARGDGLLGGIEGILKNEFGVSLLSFYTRVGAGPPVLPETWIFKIAEVAQLNMFLFLHVDRVINMEANSLAKLGLSSLEVFSCSVSDI